MSEKNENYEKNEGHERHEANPAEIHEHHDTKVEHQESHKTHEKELKAHEVRANIEKLRDEEAADELARNAEPVKAEGPKIRPSEESMKVALNKYLTDIRSHLKGTSKTYSKFIHMPKVDAVSEVTGRTIIRPTAILFAGIFMFLGSIIYLYATYTTHARYNFFVALFLFFGGFLVGLIVELFYKLFFKRDF